MFLFTASTAPRVSTAHTASKAFSFGHASAVALSL